MLQLKWFYCFRTEWRIWREQTDHFKEVNLTPCDWPVAATVSGFGRDIYFNPTHLVPRAHSDASSSSTSAPLSSLQDHVLSAQLLHKPLASFFHPQKNLFIHQRHKLFVSLIKYRIRSSACCHSDSRLHVDFYYLVTCSMWWHNTARDPWEVEGFQNKRTRSLDLYFLKNPAECFIFQSQLLAAVFITFLVIFRDSEDEVGVCITDYSY